jgi:hypothetical protein
LNRIPELIQKLREIDERRYEPGVSAFGEAAPEVLRLLKEKAPRGQSEPDLRVIRRREDETALRIVERGRPSDRIHGVRIENAWEEPELTRQEESLDLDFYNTAPQMEILLEGASRHYISGVAFHWGSPLRWNPVPAPGPGARYYKRILHPGFNSYDWFIDQALEQGGEATLESRLEIHYTESAFLPLLEMFNE